MSELQAEPGPQLRSSRDLTQLRDRLNGWFERRFGPQPMPPVAQVASPSTNGMSSETLLFDAAWSEGGANHAGSLVARVEPEASDVPVFPVYDLESQYRILRLVRDHSDVPVPHVRWLETDRDVLGGLFFVMDRVDGRVPPDVMPYTMGSWLLEASAGDQRRLQDTTVGVLASLHSIPLAGVDADFLEFVLPGATPLRRHVENQRRYYEFVREGRRFPLIEKTFEWLEAHWPTTEGDAVISWGDSRIGNVIYDGFEPAAVLDWEMAALGPREIDLAWMIFLHLFFQDITERIGMPGMPDFMRRRDVVEEYERRTGYRPRDMDFYEVYAALRHAIVMSRVHARSVHFDGAQWPDPPDGVIHHRDVLLRMLEGTFRT
jgi:aminoglycoside phosphotransferase (APT) family kinase protein